MTRVLAVHGVGLDRPWPDLGRELGERLRRWSTSLLAEVAEAAGRERVDALLVVGDLLDRATATPGTVEYAAAVLGSVGVPVVVVPGERDWYDDGSPYAVHSWPTDVTVVASATPQLCLERIWASAWTGPTASSQGVPADAEGLLVRAGVPAAVVTAERLPAGVHLLTSGDRHNDTAERVTSVGRAAGLEPAMAVLLDLPEPGAEHPRPTARRVPLSEPPVTVTDLDVTGIASDEQLREAILAAAGGPGVVRLHGDLTVGVLPPRLHAEPLPTQVAVDEERLGFREPEITPDDRTTAAELLRGLDGLGLERRQRHVATALGLRALAASEA